MSTPRSICPKCKVCYDIPKEFSERVTPLINEIINKIITGEKIPLLRSSKNENIIKHIETYMAKAMKIIQERPPCEQESDYEMWNHGGGKRSTRKLAMKKRKKSLRHRGGL